MSSFIRHCIRCGATYEIDCDELADGTYSPICDGCLREHCESNAPPDPRFAEQPIGELN